MKFTAQRIFYLRQDCLAGKPILPGGFLDALAEIERLQKIVKRMTPLVEAVTCKDYGNDTRAMVVKSVMIETVQEAVRVYNEDVINNPLIDLQGE